MQLPVIDWMKTNLRLDYVDVITEPGPDRILADSPAEQLRSIQSRVFISNQAHGSDIIVVAAHHDCAGNPASREVHCSQLLRAVRVIRSWSLPLKMVIAVWINDSWDVEVIDTFRT